MKRASGPGQAALLVLWLWLSGSNIAAAQVGTPQRERIQRERAAAEAAYSAQERACQGRFAVTACVDDARRTRRVALAELRRQSTLLDEAQRKQRAERRRQVIRENMARDEADQRELAQRPVREPRILPVERRPPAPREPAKVVRAAPARAPETKASATVPAVPPPDRAAQEAQHRAHYEARRKDAQLHRDEVKRRTAEKAARHAPAAPLPVPATSKP